MSRALSWTLHWLQAAGSLEPWQSDIAAEVDAACDAMSAVLPPPKLDILARRVSGTVIPATGFSGRAWGATLFELRFDPGNENFERCLHDQSLRRHVIHEVHHCMRMSGPGYGRTLGGALVSKGLAGQFVNRVFGNPPEPWERARDNEMLADLLPGAEALWSPRYDHDAWFFCAGGRHRDGLGYALGYWLAGRWRRRASPEGDAWFMVAAKEVIEAGIASAATL